MRRKQNSFRTFIILLIGIFLLPLEVLAVNQKIYDQAELFTASQNEALQHRAATLSEELNLDIVIVTTNKNDGKTSEAYADDFYDNNDFGYGQDADGVLLLINMQDSEVYISTCGKGIKYLTDLRIDKILDKVYPHLSKKSYSEGASAFLNELEAYVKQGIPSNQVTKDQSAVLSAQSPSDLLAKKRADLIKRMLIYLLISMIAGAVGVAIMAANNKGKIGTDESTYLDDRSFKLLHAEDRHINTTVTHVTINTDSNKSGTSSTHSSSSGRSHGGGGRKF